MKTGAAIRVVMRGDMITTGATVGAGLTCQGVCDVGVEWPVDFTATATGRLPSFVSGSHVGHGATGVGTLGVAAGAMVTGVMTLGVLCAGDPMTVGAAAGARTLKVAACRCTTGTGGDMTGGPTATIVHLGLGCTVATGVDTEAPKDGSLCCSANLVPLSAL